MRRVRARLALDLVQPVREIRRLPFPPEAVDTCVVRIEDRVVVGRIVTRHVTSKESMTPVVQLGNRLVWKTIQRVPESVVICLAHDPVNVRLAEYRADILQKVADDAVVAETRVGPVVDHSALERTVTDASSVGADEGVGEELMNGAIGREIGKGVGSRCSSTTEGVHSEERRIGDRSCAAGVASPVPVDKWTFVVTDVFHGLVVQIVKVTVPWHELSHSVNKVRHSSMRHDEVIVASHLRWEGAIEGRAGHQALNCFDVLPLLRRVQVAPFLANLELLARGTSGRLPPARGRFLNTRNSDPLSAKLILDNNGLRDRCDRISDLESLGEERMMIITVRREVLPYLLASCNPNFGGLNELISPNRTMRSLGATGSGQTISACHNWRSLSVYVCTTKVQPGCRTVSTKSIAAAAV